MIHLGFLGAAGIAPGAVIAPARRRDDVDVVAVASRSLLTGSSYVATHMINSRGRVYGVV